MGSPQLKHSPTYAAVQEAVEEIKGRCWGVQQHLANALDVPGLPAHGSYFVGLAIAEAAAVRLVDLEGPLKTLLAKATSPAGETAEPVMVKREF